MSDKSELRSIVDRLYETSDAADGELRLLLTSQEEVEYLRQRAERRRKEVYGTDVYIRGLIEVSSYCKNNCLYCGIRCGNARAERYRLTAEEILECCELGYGLGFRTFVLQGGEDPCLDEDFVAGVVSAIKAKHKDCAVTLSLGEWDERSYKRFYDAGADRYLLRHETADREHYGMLHPRSMSYDRRMKCLEELKAIGYQTGCGFMVGSPYQTVDNLVSDLRFIKELAPQMVGIGPFIPHKDTPFAAEPSGSVEMTLRLLSIIRLMNPHALLPATTALGTVDADGRSRGILAGANVIMPNLSPESVRGKYMLYNGKLSSGREAAEGLSSLRESMEKIGYKIVTDRGDFRKIHRGEKND